LHYACFHRYLSIAKYLIENQALLFVANRYGQTPLDLCSDRDMFAELNGLFLFEGEKAF
jgi:ankyrin repeat protein